MGKIQELSELLANQIAAGEVVERPASVVKELIENAIDAGSTQIEIAIEESGLRQIQVTDNGEGIAPEDVLNAFKRHATSKIHSRDDLFRIKTLGFRGEALPSIASVSEVVLETSNGSEGTYLALKGGDVISHKPHSLRRGTKITVKNLFFNTPARLKYVKSLQTELANVGDIINRLAMSHPQIAFRFVNDGHVMMKTTGNGDLKQTLAGIYGVNTAKKMIAVQKEDLDFKINGYVSLPELTRASRQYISILINGRYIKNYLLNKAIIAGYGSKLMVGRFPIVALQIQTDPLLVDVNVHPTKQEVRLSKEKELMELITSAIQAALAEKQLIPNASEQLNFKKPVDKIAKNQQLSIPLSEQQQQPTDAQPKAHRQATMKEQGLAYDAKNGRFYLAEEKAEKQFNNTPEVNFDKKESINEKETASEVSKEDPFDMSDWIPKSYLKEQGLQVQTAGIAEENSQYQFSSTNEVEEFESNELHGELDSQSITRLADKLLTEENPQQKFPELEYFGQMHGTYLFAQSQDGLYIIDQHAAQERIKYEYYRKKIGEVANDLQDLLVPIVLEYPNSDVVKIKEQTELLEEVGLHLEEFGQNSFVLRAHPTWYPAGKEEETARELIDMLLVSGKIDIAKFREATAIMMSCKRSIKANHYLNEAQARALLVDLEKCENPFNCPHGRPVLVHFTNQDMEKMFKRIQDPH